MGMFTVNRDNLIIIRSFAALTAMALVLLRGVLASPAADPLPTSPMEVPTIPLEQCTPQSVLAAMDAESQTRDRKITAGAVRHLTAFNAFATTLPIRADRPDDLRELTSKDRAEYSRMSGLMLIDWFNHRTESWLQRDIELIRWSVESKDIDQLGKHDRLNDTDHDVWGRRLIDDLKQSTSQISLDVPTNVRKCTLDLALYLRARAATQESDALDWTILRLFARASEMEYTAYRDGIIEQGVTNQDYTAKMRKAPKNLVTELALVEWSRLNTALPPKSASEAPSWPR